MIIRSVSLLLSAFAMPAGSAAMAQSAIQLGERPIKRTEMTAFVQQQFATMDSNHDRAVSLSEFEAFYSREDLNAPSGLGHVGRRWFEKTDADDNGMVSIEEALARPLQLFDMADLDGDGVASMEEQSMAQMLLGK